MSLHFSANQFEDAYAPQRLSNWQIPKSFPERPRNRHGATRTIADDAGHFSSHSGRKQNNHHLRFQSAPLPSTKPNQLFISGSAVAAAKPARVAKVNLGQRTTQPTEPTAAGVTRSKSLHQLQTDEEEGDGGEVERSDSQKSEPISIRQLVLSSNLPDHPRKAALVLAARQKNHRPLPDLILESRDALIPRNWNQPPATAITVETTKAKGPTSCTKRTVVRLLPDGETPATPLTGRRPNVMELAIKWDVTSPPSSASGTRQQHHHHPAEKTLEWLYDTPVIHRSTVHKPEGKRTNPKPLERSVSLTLQRPTANGADSGTSSRSSVSARVHPCPVDGLKTSGDSADDPESGYSSPRSSADGDNTTNHKPSSAVALTGLDDQVKTTYRSAAPTVCSSAQATPPKNHFLVSTSAFVGTDMDGRKDSILLPEYPLQRRSPVQHPAQSRPLPVETQGKKHQPTMKYHRSASQAEYSPQQEQRQRHSSGQYTMVNDRRRMEEEEEDRHYSHHHHCDRDSGIGDPHDRVEDEEEYDDRENYESHRNHHHRHQEGKQEQQPQRGQLRRSRSRPCVACIHSPLRQDRQQQQQHKPAYKPAMKAGIPNLKSHVELEKVIQRRQSYRAPKPAPLSSHARYIRGTLAPPLSAGIGNEPIVDYPDFKRLDSTYRLSYGVHPTLPQRRRPKTLTALLNEKCSRQWK